MTNSNKQYPCYPSNQPTLPPPNKPTLPKSTAFDNYREKSTFDWFTLKTYLEPRLAYSTNIYNVLAKDKLFDLMWYNDNNPNKEHSERYHTLLQQRRLVEYDFNSSVYNINDNTVPQSIKRWYALDHMLCLRTYGTGSEYGIDLHYLFSNTIQSLGTERHSYYFPHQPHIQNMSIYGCFALTEMSHGTNTRAMQTTATYNKQTKKFNINTPTIEGNKFWVGNLGKHATHCVLAAQLIIDNKNYGLHWFIVQLRDLNTHEALPGIKIGDIGQKNGWNFLDHGMVSFDNITIDRTALLNKYQDVNEDGSYVLRSVKNDNQRFALTLSALSGGRAGISQFVTHTAKIGLCIAIRYSYVRKQFSDSKYNDELPVIQYQLQNYRLFTLLSVNFALTFFNNWLTYAYIELNNQSDSGVMNDEWLDTNSELHAISSGGKPYAAWHCRDTLQTCRESMGGHGYSAASRVHKLKADSDPALTYEGENNVLIQQTSKYCVDIARQLQKGKQSKSVYNTLKFLKDSNNILDSKLQANDSNQLLNIDILQKLLQWRIIYLLQESGNRMISQSSNIKTNDKASQYFHLWNNSQVFYFHTTARAYIEYILFIHFVNGIKHAPQDSQNVLTHILYIYSLHVISQSIDIYLEGEYINIEQSKLIKSTLLEQCNNLVSNGISIIDAISPPDSALWSPLGQSNGNVYQQYHKFIQQSYQCYDRVEYWKTLRTPINVNSIKASL